ncbi:MAG: hypothetical protein V4598_13245 [Bdellovibrionota bacterium]
MAGQFLAKNGFSEKIRSFYFGMATKFVNKLPSHMVEAAWIRRSAANEDFLPVVSDIDITILIKDLDFSQMKSGKNLKTSPLMQDIQFVSTRFLNAWLETGGFRNYQIPQWKQIHGIPFQLSSPSSGTEELAFEIAYEVHLVFKQIAMKILDRNFSGEEYSRDIQKLGLEIFRLKNFWESRDPEWTLKKRDSIPFSGTLPELFTILENLCRSLIDELEPPLNVYDWKKTITSEDDLGYETAISFKGHPIFVLKDPSQILVSRKKKAGRFIVTPSYLQMMKGIGIQEQTLLNRLAKEHAYYRKFSCQRLAHDLIGALMLEPENTEQLYFCFYNIAEFHHALTGKFPDKWPEIESNWKKFRDLRLKREELERLSVSYLDHLEALI